MKTLDRRQFLQLAGCVAGASALGLSKALAAEAFPSKPMSLIVPYPAGGPSDTAARIFAESISKSLKQQVIVENLGGGTGIIGAQRILNSPPDGYSFLHGSINEVFLTPMLNPAAKYKPQDFMLSAPLSEVAIVLMVRNGIEVDTLDQFIDYARKQKDKPLTFATVGIDSIYHLMGDGLSARINAPFLHVPYKGSAPAIQGLAAGSVDFAILAYQSSFLGMQQQGRLKVLTSFSKALPAALKEIPLITQSKYVPDFTYAISGGYFVKAGTDVDRVAILRGAVNEALSKPEIRARMEAEGRFIYPLVKDQAQADQVFNQFLTSTSDLLKSVGRQS